MLQVLCTLHSWQVAGNAPRSDQCRSPCHSVVFAQVMSAAAKCGNMVAARHWFQKAKEAGMAGGSVPYSTLIAAAKANGDLGAAEAVYQEFLQANPDLKPTFIMLNALIGAAANSRQPEKAAGWLEKMKSLKVAPSHSSYGTLMNAWFRSDDHDEVLDVLEQIKNAGFHCTVVDYTMAIRSMAKAKRGDDAERLLRDMLAHQVYPNKRTLTALMDAVGNYRFQGLKLDLKLDNHFDKKVDQSGKQLARRSREVARLTDTTAVKNKYRVNAA